MYVHMSYLSSDREVAYQRAGTARGRGGETAKGGWGGWTMGPGPWIWTWTWKRELDAGAGRWALGGLVAADPVDKRASERGSPASILNLSRLAAV